MSKKGGNKKQKRFMTSKARQRDTKGGTWAVRSIAGPFTKDKSIPLGVLLRDILGIGRNMREARIVLNGGKVFVNGIKRKDYRFSVGLFDIVSIEGFENDYRIGFDLGGKLVPNEAGKDKKKSKLCRIEGQRKISGGKAQISTNDGRNIIVDDGKGFNANDSIEIEVPSQKIIKAFKFEKGARAFIMGGKHAGQEGTIKEIKESRKEEAIKSEKLVVIKVGSMELQTNAENVFIMGEEK
jgi:small subunit ribosomal protein S4e